MFIVLVNVIIKTHYITLTYKTKKQILYKYIPLCEYIVLRKTIFILRFIDAFVIEREN